MKIPNTWKDVGDGWFDGPGGAQVHIINRSAPNSIWLASVMGPDRPSKEDAERDAEQVIWALEAPPDREALARALREAGNLAMSYRYPPRKMEDGDWLSVADTALRMVPRTLHPDPIAMARLDVADRSEGEVSAAWPEGWQQFGGERVWTSGHSYAENPRVPASPSGRLAARILSGQQVSTEDAQKLRDRLAVVGRKVAQVEKERAEDQREIKIAHETLDTANVPRMAGTLSDRIRRLDERRELQRRDKLLARSERDLLRQELEHARAETRVAAVRRGLTEDEKQKAVAVRDNLIADYEARIANLETRNRQKAAALALMARELAEALGVKKVTS